MMMGERVSVKSLGEKVGIPDDPNLPKGYISAFQV